MLDENNEIKEARSIVQRLVQDLNIAQGSWAHFEAINGEEQASREELRDACNWLLVSCRGLRAALLRDTLMALARILDNGKNTALLCQLSKKLQNENIKKALQLEFGNTEWQEPDIKFFTDRVPKQWSNSSPPNPELYEWRKKLEKIRNKMLAHSEIGQNINVDSMNYIHEGLLLVDNVIGSAQRTFNGSRSTDVLVDLKKEANKFWDYAQKGFIDAKKQDFNNLIK